MSLILYFLLILCKNEEKYLKIKMSVCYLCLRESDKYFLVEVNFLF